MNLADSVGELRSEVRSLRHEMREGFEELSGKLDRDE